MILELEAHKIKQTKGNSTVEFLCVYHKESWPCKVVMEQLLQKKRFDPTQLLSVHISMPGVCIVLTWVMVHLKFVIVVLLVLLWLVLLSSFLCNCCALTH